MKLSKLFKQTFGENKSAIKNYFAPGRVNLIGEHIDYNNGSVLPFAISRGIKALVRFNQDDTPLIRIYSRQAMSIFEFDLKQPPEHKFRKRSEEWHNYPLGILHYLSEKLSLSLPSVDILLDSNLPLSSGLSSSAAMEVLLLYIFLHQKNNNIIYDKVKIAQICQYIENNFIGVNCGIMDQFIVAAAQKDHAMLLHCATLVHRHIPLLLDDVVIVVLNTNKARSLAASKYNERIQECEMALSIIQQYNNISHLSNASIADLQFVKDAVLKKRVTHIINENIQVERAVNCLQTNNWYRLGLLLNASHKSLKNNYEVSSYELDVVTNAAREQLSCFGARMTGAGFGGCAIALVEKDKTEQFIENVSNTYKLKTGLDLDCFISKAEAGVSFE